MPSEIDKATGAVPSEMRILVGGTWDVEAGSLRVLCPFFAMVAIRGRGR